jgi:hypothetical protein
MYQIDQSTGDIVINGFQGGIGVSPYQGLTDAKSVNLTNVPGEVDINFSMAKASSPSFSGATVTNVGSNGAGLEIYFTGATGLENGMAIYFTSTTIGGLTTNTPYWVFNCSQTNGTGWCNLMSVFQAGVGVSYTSGGTGTFNSYNMGMPTAFAKAHSSTRNQLYNYLVDGNGLVWTNQWTTQSGYWEYTGNTTLTNAFGQGLLYYEASNGTTAKGYLMVFRGQYIDYFITTDSANWTWHYGWTPSGSVLDTSYNKHPSIVAPNGTVYFGNGSNIIQFYQTSSSTLFDPATPSTYTTNTFPLLPFTDKVTCLTPLGQNILIGGIGNTIYNWDTISTNTTPILLPENNVQSLVTVNTNVYVFIGNRGNIYITNGTQVSWFAKVPDHLSGTFEPTFTFTGAIYNRNRLYFGIFATVGGNQVGSYTGVWMIDPVTGALSLAHQLSFGSYTMGWVSALSTGASGDEIIAGWVHSGSIDSGVDICTSNPYTGGQSYIISDAIPIGTLLKPITPQQIEFKLAKPLQVGETVELQVASSLDGTFTSVLTVNGDGSLVSGNSLGFPLQNMQWLYVKAILTGKTSSPSFNRLTELRIIGATKPMTGISNIE